MPQVILGGTRYRRYPDPSVSNLPNAQGLYAWSMLYANVAYIDGNGEVQPVSGLNDGTLIKMLLFLSDIPAIGQLKCYHTGATNAHQLSDVTNEVSVPYLVTAPGGGTPVTVDIGQVAQGYTGPGSAVRCTGFPAYGVADVVGVQTVDEVALLVWANNGVMSAPVSQNKDKGSTLVPQPILLLHTQYGPDFLRDNNIFTDTAGYKWLVVGLHDAVEPAPQQVAP